MAEFIHPITGEQIVSDWPTGKPHVSYSELSDWIQCPYRHKLYHIDKLGSFVPTPHLFFGTGVHDANEHYIKTRTMDPSRAHAHIIDGWKKNENLFLNGPFPSWAANGYGVVDDWIRKADMITADVPAFIDKMFPGWECFTAEELLYERIESHPIYLKGYVDGILTTHDKRGKKKYWIIDWKTCGWGWAREKQEDFNVQLQLVLYKNYWAKKHSIDPRDVQCAFVLMKRDGKAGNSISLVPVSIGPKVVDRGLRIIDNHVKAVTKGQFIKNRASCRFCEFDGTDHCPPTL